MTFALSLAATLVLPATAMASRPLQTLPESALARAFGADKSCTFTILGDCDSEYTQQVNMGTPCGDCTVGQVAMSTVCNCCEAGGAIDMMLDCSVVNANPAIAPKPVDEYPCGPLTFLSCQLVNNQPTCGGTRIKTALQCGTVTEYRVQSAPPG